jgi:hypothetical protein
MTPSLHRSISLTYEVDTSLVLRRERAEQSLKGTHPYGAAGDSLRISRTDAHCLKKHTPVSS